MRGKVLLPLPYLGNLEYYMLLANSEHVLIEQEEHFVKQTFRNRCSIYGANGKLDLIVPTKSNSGIRTAMKDMKISNDHPWQNLHWRTITTAYRSSAYFEFYEDEFEPFYKTKYESLWEFNSQLQEKIIELLQIEVPTELTSAFHASYEGVTDYREKHHPKKPVSVKEAQDTEYFQVFDSKEGFISNLSIIDLLFNHGPNTSSYLKLK